MAIRLNVPGLGEVVCDTAADFLELKRAVEGQKKPSGAAAKQPAALAESVQHPVLPASLSLTSPGRGTAEDVALTMLRTIRAARPRPASAEQLMRALGVSHPKGLGSVLGRAKDAIKQVGVEPDDVFSTQRTSLGRDYRAGVEFDKALALLEAQTL